jgi:uncharacterized protein (TIGR01244 family)
MVDTHKIAPELAVTVQPSKEDVQQLAQQGFRTLINNRPGGEEQGQLPPDEEKAEAERQGLTYIHIPITLSSVGRSDVDAFHRAVQESPKPVVAHCKSGTRSYLLWAAGEVLNEGRDPSELVDEAAAAGYKLQSLPDLVARLK